MRYNGENRNVDVYFAYRVIFVAIGWRCKPFALSFRDEKSESRAISVLCGTHRIILNRAGVVIPPETPSGYLFLKYF